MFVKGIDPITWAVYEILSAQDDAERQKNLADTLALRVAELEAALGGALAAIDAAMCAGCVEHLDCWENAREAWWKPLRVARDLIRWESSRPRPSVWE